MSPVKRSDPGKQRLRRPGPGDGVKVDLEPSTSPPQALESLRRAKKIVARWILSKALSNRPGPRGENR